MRLSLITNQLTNPWDNYLKNINKKHIRPYKAQGTIFGTEAKGEKVEERRTWIQWKIDEIQKKGRTCNTAKIKR